MSWIPLPVGIENYAELIEKGYYYIDKTLLIKDLIDLKGKVNLFTRPRRFGKTLNLSMLRYFFEKSDVNPAPLFEGTKIWDAGHPYTDQMGQYPVITLSLKSLKQTDFKSAFYCLREEIAREFDRHASLVSSLDSRDKQEKYNRFVEQKAAPEEYLTSLRFLSDCLYTSSQTRCIILIDEYDVPLENAYFHGFYTEMLSLIRSVFESALKTNDTLEFAVVTGCLRISKESIFTGLNNLSMISIMDQSYAEHFGFTQEEVDQMLRDYQLEDRREDIRKWYDGYCFGNTEVYNPWSVINDVNSCYKDKHALFKPYWSNTSSNSIVRTLIEKADLSVRQEIESLIAGGTIIKPVHEDITYADIDTSQDYLWNFLFFTGYLKKRKQYQENGEIYMELAIPNMEVRHIYKHTVLLWFEEKIKMKDLSELYRSILDGDRKKLSEFLSEMLMETISFYDYQENYYHGFLAGLLKHFGDYIVVSNRESGSGRPDLILKYPSVRGKAVIFEIKTADSYQDLECRCDEALQQIEKRHYADSLRKEGYQTILKYGVAFYKKECMVK